MEEGAGKEERVLEKPPQGGTGGGRSGAVPSLATQCLRVKFGELGRERLLDGEAGTEPSSAGKTRRRSGGRQKSWVDLMAGRDYLGKQQGQLWAWFTGIDSIKPTFFPW